MTSLLCSRCGEEHGSISLLCTSCLQELQAATPGSLESKEQWLLENETQLRAKQEAEWKKILAEHGLVEAFSHEVAEAIRNAAKGEEIPYTWLVRWSQKKASRKIDKYFYDERVVGHAWVLAACGGWEKRLPWIIPENGSYQDIWVNQVEPFNKADLEDAKRAQELGMNVSVQPKYKQPKPVTVTTKEEFEQIVRTARPSYVDDAIRGNVVTGHEPGWDEEGRPIDVPVFGNEIEYGPGFRVDGVPQEWIGTYSRLIAYTKDGATKFEASFSNGGGGPVNLGEVPEDAEWRIPRNLVEQILQLMEESSQLRREEEEELNRKREANERKRLAAKFGVSS